MLRSFSDVYAVKVEGQNRLTVYSTTTSWTEDETGSAATGKGVGRGREWAGRQQMSTE